MGKLNSEWFVGLLLENSKRMLAVDGSIKNSEIPSLREEDNY